MSGGSESLGFLLITDYSLLIIPWLIRTTHHLTLHQLLFTSTIPVFNLDTVLLMI